jgi:hypothetical protein
MGLIGEAVDAAEEDNINGEKRHNVSRMPFGWLL